LLAQKKSADVPASAPAALDPRDILTPQELAARLKVKPGWIYERLRRRQANPPPALKVGRYLRFYWPAVCDWLLSLERPARKGAA